MRSEGKNIRNWFGDINLKNAVVVEVESVDDIRRVLQDDTTFPSPVRANGPSSHSTTRAGAADGPNPGTILRMSKLNQVLNIDRVNHTVTAQAGAYYRDVAKALEACGLQFYVNTEIGSLSLGSAACAGTKDASMPDLDSPDAFEFGQVGSYITCVKLVLPDGTDKTVSEESDPELLQKVRSSHGLFGVIYEVTFRVRPLVPLRVVHKTYELDEFASTLFPLDSFWARVPELGGRPASMMFYLFPFDDKITVEFRQHNPTADISQADREVWDLRNIIWKLEAPFVGHSLERAVQRFVPAAATLRRTLGSIANLSTPALVNNVIPGFRDLQDSAANLIQNGRELLSPYYLYDLHHAWIRAALESQVRADNTVATDQIIRYPATSSDSRYTFALWAFPETSYPVVLRKFFEFSRRYFEETGYRTNLPNVGYRISHDQKALLSYSFNGPVMTIDPVSTGDDPETFRGNEGESRKGAWLKFVDQYNQFCHELDLGGVPLNNQTVGLTREMVKKAVGERLETLAATRRTFDPHNRLLNDYFREILGEPLLNS